MGEVRSQGVCDKSEESAALKEGTSQDPVNSIVPGTEPGTTEGLHYAHVSY